MGDCIFLLAMEIFSALPYLFKLGFYSDDWGYQAALAQSSGQGIGAMFRALLESDSGMLVRPVQYSYLVFGFLLFGRQATAYHILYTAMLGGATVFLYLALREIGASRWLALALALLFGTLPHYSTDRFWIASHQATLCMTFALLGIYALLRSLRSEGRSLKAWATLGVVAPVLSILSYEVALGLIIASLATIAGREYLSRRGRLAGLERPRQLGGVVFATGAMLLAGLVKCRMQRRLIPHGHFVSHFLPYLGKRCGHAVVQAVRFNLWSYGLKMPAVLLRLYRDSALSWTAVVSASIFALLVTGYLWRCLGTESMPDRRTCLGLVLLGFVLFGLGYGLFFLDVSVEFSTPGFRNRVVIASALGAACALAGMVGLASSVLPSPVIRARVCCAAMGMMCGMNCLVLYGISSYWAEAASQQSKILSAVSSNVRSLPRGSVLLLDGFCRYLGPADVFEAEDAGGALQLALGDPSLTGDVVSPLWHLDDAALVHANGDQVDTYPYGRDLFVFNLQRQTLTSLPSKEAASAYFQSVNPSLDSGCPAAEEGVGTTIF